MCEEIVTVVNSINKLLDSICQQYNFHRQFSVTDEYIISIGMPFFSFLPANFAVQTAQEILDAMKQLGKDVLVSKKLKRKPDLRIGIDLGGVVGTVVSVTMPRFIIFGKPVSVAIHISQESHVFFF